MHKTRQLCNKGAHVDENISPYDASDAYKYMGDVIAAVSAGYSEESIIAAAAAGLTVSSVKASFTNLPEKYNALEKTVSGNRASVEYAVSAPCDEAFKAGYKTIAYAYVPVGNGDNYLTDATLVINDGARTVSVTSLPIKANYRTNIIGNLFTSGVDYTSED